MFSSSRSGVAIIAKWRSGLRLPRILAAIKAKLAIKILFGHLLHQLARKAGAARRLLSVCQIHGAASFYFRAERAQRAIVWRYGEMSMS